jgi:hypothetical protein
MSRETFCKLNPASCVYFFKFCEWTIHDYNFVTDSNTIRNYIVYNC